MTLSESTLLDLAARVERGEGADREIDCLVGAVTDIQFEGVTHPWRALVEQFGIEWAVGAATDGMSIWRTELPRYTTSLDAVTALLERVLPGWKWELHSQGGAVLSVEQAGELHEVIAGHASSPARALLAATLRALADAHKNQRTTP